MYILIIRVVFIFLIMVRKFVFRVLIHILLGVKLYSTRVHAIFFAHIFFSFRDLTKTRTKN